MHKQETLKRELAAKLNPDTGNTRINQWRHTACFNFQGYLSLKLQDVCTQIALDELAAKLNPDIGNTRSNQWRRSARLNVQGCLRSKLQEVCIQTALDELTAKQDHDLVKKM